MKENRSKNIVIVLLVVIIVILLALVVLFATNTISFNNNVNDNNKLGNGIIDNANNNEDSLKNNKLNEAEAFLLGKELYDKVTEIYETWVLRPYCGYDLNDINSQIVEIEELGNSGNGNGQYYKTVFSSFDELVNYLGKWLSKDIIDEKVRKSYEWNGETYYEYVDDLSLLSGNSQYYSYVDYAFKDNQLYCRLDTGKGWRTRYLDMYNINIDSIEENKITYTIKSTYVKEEAFDSCYSGNIVNCTNEQLEYKNTNFVIERNENNNWVVTKYTLHE